jgi:hypothetical protein
MKMYYRPEQEPDCISITETDRPGATLEYEPEYELLADRSMPGTWYVFNADTGFVAGKGYWKDGRYRVVADFSRRIGSVNSADLILPTIAMHHKRHPPRWKREATEGWSKWTHYGWLKVKRIDHRLYELYRSYKALCDENRHLVRVTSLDEAKRLADLHMRQGYPNAARIDDGLSWDINPVIDHRWICR